MRRLDFPYKKRTQITSKSSKVTLTWTTRAGTSGLARNFRAEIISSSPLALNLQVAYYFGWRWSQKQSCRSCNGEKLFSWSLFHPRSSWCRNRPRKSANNVKISVFGAHRVQTFGLARNLPGSFARNFRGKLMQHTVLALTFAYELRFRRFYIEIDRLDETKTIRVEMFPIWGHLGGVIKRIVFSIQISVFRTQLRP